MSSTKLPPNLPPLPVPNTLRVARPVLPPLPPSDGFEVVHISSLTAALAKLKVDIPIESLMKAIGEEDEARRVKIAAERRAAMVRFALQPIEPPTAGFEITTVSRFDPNPSTPSNIDTERRRRLLELHNEAFPDGNVPDPFAVTRLGLNEDAAANKLPSSLPRVSF